MDHVWNSLYQWERIWLQRIEDEEKSEYRDSYEVALLNKQLKAIQKAMEEVGKWN